MSRASVSASTFSRWTRSAGDFTSVSSGPRKSLIAKGSPSSYAPAASKSGKATFSERFLIAEWEQVVDAWQVATWEAYREVPRLGRKTRLPEKRARPCGRFSRKFGANLVAVAR